MDRFTYKNHSFVFTFSTAACIVTTRKRFKFHPDSVRSITCIVYDDSGTLVAAGTAWSHKVDKYSEQYGKKLALHRALLGFHLTKKQRAKVWKRYLKELRRD